MVLYLERAPQYQPFSRYPLATNACQLGSADVDTPTPATPDGVPRDPSPTFFPTLESFPNRLLSQNQLPSGFAFEPIPTPAK